MAENNFTLNYNVTGSERKWLVRAISEHTGADAKYLGMPSMAYEVDYFTIDKNGCVSFDDRADSEEIEDLTEALDSQGFVAQANNSDSPEAVLEPSLDEQANAPADQTDGLTVSMPLDLFTPDAIERLEKLIDSKAALIKKALGADRLTVETANDKVNFNWFDRLPSPEETQAYSSFIVALCKMAKDAVRVNASEKTVENEKYAFRCFLLRLGFIGPDCKAQRKVLLKNLSGSAAFPTKAGADAFSANQKAKRDAEKEAAV